MRSNVAVHPPVKTPLLGAAILLLTVLAPAPAFASHNDDLLDSAGLAQLEDRAEHAGPREQCFLFTELVQHYTDVAGKQMAAGEMEQASASLKRIQTFAERIHMGLARDSKRLKNAEMIMHTAEFRLSQLMQLVSTEDEAIVKSTLRQLNRVHDELLAQVFAH